jgi:transcriptional regulator with XRE-family HTH domain
MRIQDILRKRRTELGISDVELSKLTNISIDTIYDLEQMDDDEIYLFNLPELKLFCSVLKINPPDIFRSVASDLTDLSLAELIKKRRNEKNLTIEKLSDLIGYDPIVILTLEENGNYTEVCVDALKKISFELDLPLELLLEKI